MAAHDPPPSGTLAHTCTELQALQSRPWEIFIRPQIAGRYEHRMAYFRTPSIIAYREHFRIRTHIQGSAPSDMLVLSFPIRLGDRSRYWRTLPDKDTLPAMIGGGADVVFDSGQMHLVVMASLKLLRDSMPEPMFEHLRKTASRLGLQVGRKKIVGFTRWLDGLIDVCNVNPYMLEDAWFIKNVETELILNLMDVLPDSESRADSSNPTRRHRALVRALEYLREKDLTSVTIPDLARDAEVSQRTLEYAFRDAFEMTPVGYLHMWKLHAARRALMKARVGNIGIAEIIHSLGIYHAGRFAMEYRKRFGELPSETLSNKYPGIRQSDSLFLHC